MSEHDRQARRRLKCASTSCSLQSTSRHAPTLNFQNRVRFRVMQETPTDKRLQCKVWPEV